MKKRIKIGCLALVVLVVIALVANGISKWNDAPTQHFNFLNSADVVRSVTFERIQKDSTLSDTYAVNLDVKPNKEVIEKVTEGNYRITVWNQDETYYNSTDFKVVLEDPTKSNYQLYRFDLAMDKIYAIVYLNALYEGNSFAEQMAKAAGTSRERLKIEQFYDGVFPFFVPETYTYRTFVDINDKLPKKIKYGEMVYGLFAFPKTLEDDEIETELYRQIIEKMK